MIAVATLAGIDDPIEVPDGGIAQPLEQVHELGRGDHDRGRSPIARDRAEGGRRAPGVGHRAG